MKMRWNLKDTLRGVIRSVIASERSERSNLMKRIASLGFALLAMTRVKEWRESCKLLIVFLIIMCAVNSRNVWGEESPTAVILPFYNSSGSDQFKHLDSLIPELIGIYFVYSQRFSVVDREYLQRLLAEQKMVLSGTTTTAESLNIGKLTNAKMVMSGSFVIDQEKIIINASLSDVETGKILSTQEVKGQIDQLARLIKKLNAKIVDPSQKTPVDVSADSIDQSPVSNLHFMQGLSYYFSAQYHQAIGEFILAAEEDKVSDIARWWMANSYIEKEEYGHAYVELKKIKNPNGETLKKEDIEKKMATCLSHVSPEEAQLYQNMF